MAASQPRKSGRSRSRANREGPAFLDDLLAMAGSLASSRKDYASAQLENLADTMRQFSEALPAMPTVKTYAETAADSLEDLANYVLDSNLPEIVKDARELARRHPLATFGGSVVAGVLLTQLVQARAETMRASFGAQRQRTASRARRDTAADDVTDADAA